MNTSGIIPETPEQFAWLLMSGQGALFGVISVWVIDAVIKWMQERSKKSRSAEERQLSESKQRWVSIGVPIVMVFIGYALTCALGVLPFTLTTFYSTAVGSAVSVGTKQSTYAASESFKKRKPRPKPRRKKVIVNAQQSSGGVTTPRTAEDSERPSLPPDELLP
jgi:hypothetical protein